MEIQQIVAELIAERDRLSRAIDALQGGSKRRGRPPGSAQSAALPQSRPSAGRKRGKLSAAGRKAIADAARRRWALIKAGKASSPFSKKVKSGK